jgi:hypothetical protein
MLVVISIKPLFAEANGKVQQDANQETCLFLNEYRLSGKSSEIMTTNKLFYFLSCCLSIICAQKDTIALEVTVPTN